MQQPNVETRDLAPKANVCHQPSPRAEGGVALSGEGLTLELTWLMTGGGWMRGIQGGGVKHRSCGA